MAQLRTSHQVTIPKIVFGCGHNNDGTFGEARSGIIGLGGGPLSLVSQLNKSIGGKFSYCLVLTKNSNVTSKINFGSNGLVSGNGVVSTIHLFILGSNGLVSVTSSKSML